MNMLKFPEDQPIENNLVSGVIESAQTKIEGMNFDLRKHVLEYDDVLNKHREVIYKKRKEIIEQAQGIGLKAQILEIIKKAGFKEEDYEKKEKEIGEANMRQVEKVVSLRVLDMLWLEHLENMDYLRDSVRLRAYGQQDPLIEYKNEGHKMFRALLNNFESFVANTIFKVTLAPASPPVYSNQSRPGSPTEAPRRGAKVGRNDPCPCGKISPQTGKPMKYKKCCYPKFG